jgi:hypothetical protein
MPTNSTGYYEFTGLMPGSYIVKEIGQNGWVNTTLVEVPIEIVDSDEEVNFGNVKVYSISGYKLHDITGLGLSGWTIELYDSSHMLIASNITSSDPLGYYEFDGLLPGTYYVKEILQNGWTNTTSIEVEVEVIDQNVGNVNFKNKEILYRIYGYKFYDENKDGIRDPAEGLGGWTIELRNATTNEIIATKITNGTGYYEFTGLEAGSYKVKEVPKSGWVHVSPEEVLIEIEATDVQVDFRNMPIYEISGYKFNDMNNNTIFDLNESGIPEWEIQLWNASDLLETTTTNGTGYYEFTGLEAGSYKVIEILKPGWKNTTLMEIEVVLPGPSISGNVSDVNFGNFELGVKGGYKWEDLNGDGIWDDGEPELDGWEIKLFKWDVLLNDWVYQSSDFTDGNGYYEFTGLTAGSYKVEEEPQDGWIQTYPKEPPYYEFTVISGFRDLDNNFGNFEEKTVKKTFELTLTSCHPWTSLKYYGAVRLAGSQDGWTSVELIRVGTSLLWNGMIDNLKPGEYEWKIYTVYDGIEIVLKSGQEVISEDKVNSFTFGKTSLEVWKTVDKVEKLDGSYKVTGKIYINNIGSYDAYILSIEDFVERRDGSNWVKFANGVVLDFSPGHIIPPGETHTFDYYVIITFPTLVPIKPLSSALGNQGFTGFCFCPPTDQWRNVVKVTLFNSPSGIRVYTYRISFSLPT